MKLPKGVIEWFYVPTPGQRGCITGWQQQLSGSTVPLRTTQTPFVVLRGETVRVATGNDVVGLVAYCWCDGVMDQLLFQLSSTVDGGRYVERTT